MKYYALNPALDEKIGLIKTKIRLSMDGVVAEKLNKMGISYKNNYGVSLFRLKELAAEFGSNYDLSLRLWHLHERETMILAILTMPVDKFSKSLAMQWMHEVENIELSEQLSTHLIPKCEFAIELCLNAIARDNTWANVCAYQVLARLYNDLSEIDAAKIALKVENSLATEDIHLQKAMARCMSRIARKHGTWVENWVENSLQYKISNRTVALIIDEISQELKYFL